MYPGFESLVCIHVKEHVPGNPKENKAANVTCILQVIFQTAVVCHIFSIFIT